MQTLMAHLRGNVQYVLICLAEIITHCGQNDIKYVKGKHLHSNSKPYLLLTMSKSKCTHFALRRAYFSFLLGVYNIQCMGQTGFQLNQWYNFIRLYLQREGRHNN